MARPNTSKSASTGADDVMATAMELSQLKAVSSGGDMDMMLGTGDMASKTINSDDNASLSFGQALRRHLRLAGWTLALSSAIVLTGFDINIVSNVASLPEFQCATIFAIPP